MHANTARQHTCNNTHAITHLQYHACNNTLAITVLEEVIGVNTYHSSQKTYTSFNERNLRVLIWCIMLVDIRRRGMSESHMQK